MRTIQRRINLFMMVAAVIACAEAAHAATYYVSPRGDDRYSCDTAQSDATPKRTFNSAVACLRPGETLVARAGIYNESLIRNVPSGTSWDNVVRITAYSGETVWLRPTSGARVLDFGGSQQYIEFDGINLDGSYVGYDTVKINGASETNNAHHIRIRDAELIGHASDSSVRHQLVLVTAAANGLGCCNQFINLKMHRSGNTDLDHAFYLESSGNLIEWCDISGVTGNGVQFYNQGISTDTNNNTVRYNFIHDLTAWIGRHRGVVISRGRGNKVYGNLIYKVAGPETTVAGIHVGLQASEAEIYNNTVHNATVGIRIDSGVSGVLVRNNISYGNKQGDFQNNGTSTTVSNNLFGVDPAFVDAANLNFRLKSSSGARDKGISLNLVGIDLDGTKRPQGGVHDIGAFEFLSEALPPRPPTNVRIVQD